MSEAFAPIAPSKHWRVLTIELATSDTEEQVIDKLDYLIEHQAIGIAKERNGQRDYTDPVIRVYDDQGNVVWDEHSTAIIGSSLG